MADPANSNFDQILSTTLHNYRPTLEDNVFAARALLFWLKSNDRIQFKSGGAKIVVPLLQAHNTTAETYAGGDTLTVTHQDGITAAEYDWRQQSVSVNIYGIEEAKNNGPEEVIDLVEAKIMQAEESAAAHFNEMFFGEFGTFSANATDDWLSIKSIVDDTGTIGNIAGATESWWRSTVNDNGGVDKSLTIGDMTNVYNTVSRGSDSPDAVFTTQTLFEKYESLLQPSLRFQSTKVADGGFQNLLFKTAPVMFDEDCTAKYMYFLNSKYIKLTVHRDKFFSPTQFVKPHNGDFRVAQLLTYGNLVTSARKRHGRLESRIA